MYWRYKLPLILLLVGLGGYFCFMIGKNCLPQKPEGAASGENGPLLPNGGRSLPELDELPPPPPPEKDEEALKRITLDLTEEEIQNSPIEARIKAQEYLDRMHEGTEWWMEGARVINEINRSIMNSTIPAPEKITYTVESGDTLDGIARAHHTTVGGLQRMNELNPTNSTIYPGKKFKIIQGKWSIRISKKNFLLCLYLDQELYRIYKISTGKQDRTPFGSFVICNKSMQPSWTQEPGVVIPYGDPKNILGTRWMGLKPIDRVLTDVEGLGIHGTTEPESIGTASSLGCIRLLNEDVEELYDFIPEPRNASDYVIVEIRD